MPTVTSRRAFLGLCGAVTLAALPLPKSALAAPARLQLNDPTAKALGYVESTTQIKAGSEAAYKVGNNCGNCVLYVKAQEAGGYAPCGAVGGKLVAKKGWCRAYAAAG